MDALQVAAAAFVALLPITNPIGAIAAYAGMTSDMSHGDRTRQAVKTGMYVAAILVVFALLGSVALKGLGITVPALQIAGGLVVAHSGFSMLSAQPRLTSNEQTHAIAQNDVSFSPMALPLIAGPGAIGVVIALSARNPDLLDRIGVACAGAALGAVIAVSLRYGTPVVDKLGHTGVGALTRVMGFLIMTIGVELLIHGSKAAFG